MRQELGMGSLGRHLLACLLVSCTRAQMDSQLQSDRQNQGSPCYENESGEGENLGKSMRCMPPFKNVVANMSTRVDPEWATCGTGKGQAQFCIQTGGYRRECDVCDTNNPEKHHNAVFLTDVEKEDDEETHWQSVTMFQDVHYVEEGVNLTMNLGKAFDITYVRLKFSSPRPETFAIYKKNRRDPWRPDPDPEEGWVPWQYYSAYCEDQFSVPDLTSIIQPRAGPSGREQVVGEDRALCTSEFSDISPLTGGNVAFSTLEGRPSSYNFDNSQELQHWVSATDVRISLMRLNTFGDEVFGDQKVLESYYYGITHVVVGGRCKCNGHSNVCIMSSEHETDRSGSPIPVHPKCLCQHGTTGDDCGSCLDDHWDRPWRRATQENANECLPCECNGWSSKCRFNEMLYDAKRKRGGGECMECEGNRGGAHCEICKENSFPSPVKDAQGRQECVMCDCDPNGSTSAQCREDGKCECKPGVAGEKCDQCEANYYSFPGPQDEGCQFCECRVEGSIGNRPSCNEVDGQCECKQNVEGRRCDRCKSGHFQIDLDNDFGCTPCFCFGHTASCLAAPNYFESLITSDFNRGSDNWQTMEYGLPAIEAQTAPFEKAIALKAVQDVGYFVAPEKFLGDRRASHNQQLTFSLRLGGDDSGARASAEDIVIEGGGSTPIRITLAITDQNNPMPSITKQKYTFKLHENPEFNWSPSLNSKTFIGLLSNITSIKIRGSYIPNGQGFLDEVQLETASMDGSGKAANWVEYCQCPPGFEGQFCERCVTGHYHENNGGSFARCIPCQCNGHSDYCDPESGVCRCEHNTGGDQCQLCADGYFGDAISGDVNSCQACPCPYVQDDVTGVTRPGMCLNIQGDPNSPMCTECPPGRTGSRCEVCEDGFFGDPLGQNGPQRPCQKCNCNDNVDKSAIGNCDRNTGECLRCIDDTSGFRCETCKSGFYGDALVPRSQSNQKNCNPCQCHPLGTHHADENNDGIFELPICNAYSGKCECKDNVAGQNCDTCRDGYWDLESNVGCKDCNCNIEGSYNATCDIVTGHCFCKPGVVGAQCDQCQANHYGFSMDGCQFCDCDPTGSLSHQCDLVSGQCPCRNKVEGRKCDRCEENTKTRTKDGFEGVEKFCEPCDDCYNLVQNATDDIRNSLLDLTNTLTDIANNPAPVGANFAVSLRRLQLRVKLTVSDAKLQSGAGNGGGVLQKFEKLQEELKDVQDVVLKANAQLDAARRQGDQAGQNVGMAENQLAQAKETLKNARSQLDVEGREALRRAEDMAIKMGAGNAKITEVAQMARKLAAEQAENASEVESIANQAEEESSKAYDKAMNAMNEQLQNKNDIDNLKVQLQDMADDLAEVQSQSVVTLTAASDSYDKAMQNKILASGLEVPDIVTSGPGSIEEKANAVIKDAERIREVAESLIQNNMEVVSEVVEKTVELENLLGQQQQQQQHMDDKLAQMDVYRGEARKAVELGNDVLSQAQDTLQVLEQFENQVEQNRAESEAIVNEIPEIEEMLRNANGNTNQAANNMRTTDTDLALDIAKESKVNAEEASTEAQRIVSESSEAKSLVQQLKAAAEDMAEKQATTSELVAGKEEAAARDAQLANEALREANKAQSSSAMASNKVEQAKMELDEITSVLQNIEDPDPNLLNDLSARLDDAERKYMEADLEERLKELEEAKQRQIVRKTELRKEYELVKAEMEVIAGIIEQLPPTCPMQLPNLEL